VIRETEIRDGIIWGWYRVPCVHRDGLRQGEPFVDIGCCASGWAWGPLPDQPGWMRRVRR
jgi:hypothetical protein